MCLLGVILNCQDLNGDSSDKHTFDQWLPQLNTVINANTGWDDAGKLTYLKSKVKGCAKNIIRPVKQEEGGFKQAIDALKHRFSNVKFNKDQLFAKISNSKPLFCPEYKQTENYIAEIRATLLDLKNHFNADLLEKDSGGYQYISHVVFSKLSFEMQTALMNKLSNNYPTFDEIYDNHIEIIHHLNRTRRKKVESKDFSAGAKSKKQFTQSSDAKPFNQTENFASAASQVRKFGTETVYHCRLCGTDGHASSYCRIY